MDKCNICAQLRAVGETPACVRNCPGRALHVGDINDPDSEVSRLLQDTPPSLSTPCGTLAMRPAYAIFCAAPSGRTSCRRTAKQRKEGAFK